MKIQDLAIIFVIIIIPISLILSVYTQFQMKTINMQTLYDEKLTSATYDAIKAFQLNSANSTTSDLANSKLRDLEASIVTFRNSLKSAFELNGYTEEQLNNYIPALVYTLYDGFYIYSPYENTNHRYENEEGKVVTDPSSSDLQKADENGENLYGLKPYITYSCRYKIDDLNDFVITYSLDNYIVIQGMIKGKYVNDEGYLIEDIEINSVNNTVYYNGFEIEQEGRLMEYLPFREQPYPYVKLNGIKYYLDEGDISTKNDDQIFSLLNGTVQIQCYNDPNNSNDSFDRYYKIIDQNTLAQSYYKQAYAFTERVMNEYGLYDLKYSHAIIETINEDGTVGSENIWVGDTRKIFNFGSGVNIENELSNFNQHRLAVIRHKIETNLAIAIANYNNYSGATNEFQMPELKEDEWDYLINNISVISFLQGLPIGGKIYNGYTVVTNSESKEVVLEENIYILGKGLDGKFTYHRIGDKGLEINGGTTIQAGRINLDFKRQSVSSGDGTMQLYYYPLKNYNASYDSIVTQNNITTFDDIYEYVNSQNEDLRKAFYIALGRERASKYNPNVTIDTVIPEISETPETPEMSETYTVTYDANGGTGGSISETQNVGTNTILKASNTFVAPSGKHFLGWSTNSSGTSTIYNTGSTHLFNTNTTLYAIWEEHISDCYEEHVHTNSCYSDCRNCGEMGYRHDVWGCDSFEAELDCSETRKLTCGGTE